MYLIQSALHDTFRSHTAIFLDQMLLQGTTVDAHADRDSVFFCLIHHRLDPVSGSDVSRIDPDLIGSIFNGCNGKTVVKMNIRYQWNVDLLLDLADSLCRFFGWHCHTDDITARLLQLQDLFHCFFYMFRLGVAHGLDQDRIATADHPVSNMDHLCIISAHMNFLHSFKQDRYIIKQH